MTTGIAVPPKAHESDFEGRFREIICDPLNLLIEKHPLAGTLIGNEVILHCGTHVPVSGPYSYYGDFSRILLLNRGVHEPLEEFVFQSLIQRLPAAPRMLELGAYWAHYSMWLKTKRTAAAVTMVEADGVGLETGRTNFRLNDMEGTFIHAFVGIGGFEIDRYFENTGAGTLDILHADIQGHEVQMLQGARRALHERRIDYIFVSTHSQKLHAEVKELIRSLGYRVEVQADFDFETTSMDGFVFASSPRVPALFKEFKPLGRTAITSLSPAALTEYLHAVTRSVRALGPVGSA